MPADVTTYKDEPIIIADWSKGEMEDPTEEVYAVHKLASGIVDTEGWDHAYLIYDLNTIEMNFSDLIMALSELHGEKVDWLRERLTVVFVGPEGLTHMIGGANQEARYGSGPVASVVASSREDALNQIAESAG